MADGREGKGMGLPQLSMWALLARGSFYKILLLLVILVLLEVISFYGSPGGGARFLDRSRMGLMYLNGVGQAAVILSRCESLLDGKCGGTLMRLRVTQKRFFVIKVIYNILCLVLLAVVQIWTAVVLVKAAGMEAGGGELPPQYVFLAFYDNPFLHVLLPMADISWWVHDLLMTAALGMAAACASEKRGYMMLIVVYIMAAYWIVGQAEAGVQSVSGCIGYVTAIVAMAVWVKRRKRVPE